MRYLLHLIQSWFDPPPSALAVGNSSHLWRPRFALLVVAMESAESGPAFAGTTVAQQLVPGALPASTEER